MALVLFVVGLLMLTLLFARELTTTVKENLNLTVLLDDNITSKEYTRLKQYLDNAYFVKSKKYISKQEALKEYIDVMGINPEDVLGENPLRATYEIKLLAKYANNENIYIIEKELLKRNGVLKVNYQDNMIALVNENVRKLSVVFLGLTIVLLLISMSLINNTIRLKIYSNRFLINTMKLVGAKSSFIRKPYIKSSILNGSVSAIFAFLFIVALLFYFNFEFGVSLKIITKESLLIVFGIMFLLGTILTAMSTY
ncbi:MAG: cell division protein FtsX, partial [Paludibacter sp.]